MTVVGQRALLIRSRGSARTATVSWSVTLSGRSGLVTVMVFTTVPSTSSGANSVTSAR